MMLLPVAYTTYSNNLSKLSERPTQKCIKVTILTLPQLKKCIENENLSTVCFESYLLHEGNETSSQGCSGCLNTPCKAVMNLCRKAKCQQQKM